jgi:hypothetical protein
MGFAIYDLASGGPPDYAAQAANQETARQGAITSGKKSINNAFAGFTPKFYQKRQQAYLDYALPQFADQYNQTKGAVGFGLANKGLDKSSQANKSWSDLFHQTATAEQGIADSARGQSQALQEQVAASKNNLMSMLYQSADPGAAASQATSTAASLQAPSTFAPLANQFSGLLNQYYLSSILSSKPSATSVPNAAGPSFAPLPGASQSVGAGGY